MPVPRMVELHPGTHVNVVLKADQRSGRLTSGRVAAILTRGDHPRGIKVRLADGQIGRVQSLGSGGDVDAVPPLRGDGAAVTARASGFQKDYREGVAPRAAASLFDYVRAPKQKGGVVGGAERSSDAVTLQQQLEGEFPQLDAALIAAILSDHESDVDAARATLISLS